MLVSFIIVNYNTGSILKDCIESIFKNEIDVQYEIIIVDNHSTDNSKHVIGNISDQRVKAIHLENKISFSAANNIGFDSSRGDYILIMNPDIIFTEPVLKKLIADYTEDTSLGAVSPLLTGADGNFQRRYFQRYPSLMQYILFYSVFAGIFEKSSYFSNKYLQNNEMNISSDKMEFVEQIPCAFFLTKRKIFEESGKMDDHYFLFFEDVDLSYQINKNFKLAVDTSLSVTHLGGASFKTSDDYWLYGRFIIGMINFFRKNYGPGRTFILKTSAVMNSGIIVLMERFKKIFGKEDDYRLRKHKFFLNELKRTRANT